MREGNKFTIYVLVPDNLRIDPHHARSKRKNAGSTVVIHIIVFHDNAE
jgi:hypothetical protein